MLFREWKAKHTLILFGMILAVICIWGSVWIWRTVGTGGSKTIENKTSTVKNVSKGGIEIQIAKATPEPKPEDSVYTYFQGPKAWKQQLKWSGVWGKTYYDGGLFGGFGCGFCCIANIYSTCTEYKCSPVDAYRMSKKHTDYGGGGAIEWNFLQTSMEYIGFSGHLRKKPKTYSEFQHYMKASKCIIALVCSNDDNAYWKETPGHYVTAFLYDEKTDKVFLGDSGDLKHNRQWIPLKTIYKALKRSSKYQYFTVGGYSKEKDKWRWNKISEAHVL